MSDDLNKKIKQIADLLGQETVPDNIKGLLSMLAASPDNREESVQKTNEAVIKREDKSSRQDFDDSLDTMRRVKLLMDRVNSNSDPRLNLINAIRPFLNGKRQKKLNNCMKLLQMTRLTKLMEDNDK